MDVDVKFLGNSQLLIEGKKINIPQNKVKAILFYILYKAQVTRDELVAIFWEQFNEEDAKNNLRNVLYKIRHTVDKNILLTNGNNEVYINPEMRVHRDIDIFMDENNEDELRLINDFDFLADLRLRECPEFEDWLRTVGSAYQRMLLHRFMGELEKNLFSSQLDNIFGYANKILRIDPFNENAYNGLLITLYNQGRFHEAIKLFAEYEQLLEQELGVKAGEKTRNLYEQILRANKFQPGDESAKIFFHAHREIENQILDEVECFLKGEEAQHCLLCGEIGTGKSELVNSVLKRTNPKISRIELHIYETHRKHSFLIKLLSTFQDFDSESSTDFGNYMKTDLLFDQMMQGKKKKTVVHIKNLQYADPDSLYIFKEQILKRRNGNFFFLMEFTESFDADFDKNFFMKRADEAVKVFQLELLTKKETEDYFWYLKNSYSGLPNSYIYFEDVYSNSCGNLMFVKNEIFEKCRAMGQQEDDLETSGKIEELFRSLNTKEKIIFKILSVSDLGMELSILQTLTSFEYYELVDTINRLIARKVAVEKREGNFILICLKYRTMKKYIYHYVNRFELQATHESCAKTMEEHYGMDCDSYYVKNELFYHYKHRNDTSKELYYEVYLVKDRLDYLDQFFPAVKHMQEIPREAYQGKGEIFLYLKKLYERIHTSKAIFSPDVFHRLRSEMMFLMGRTLIRQGKGEQGTEYIRDLMEESTHVNDRYFLYKAYLEMLLYNMRRSAFREMLCFLEKAFLLNREECNEAHEGELFRLQGLYHLLTGDLEEAIEMFRRSLEIFGQFHLREENAIQIAAAHSYLGEIYRKKERFDLSEKNHKKAVHICLTNGINKPLDCFYESYGFMLFTAGRIKEAKKILLDSLGIYDMYGTHWHRSVAESCLGLIALQNDEKNDALLYFRKAEIFSQKYKTENEVLLLNRLREELKKCRALN